MDRRFPFNPAVRILLVFVLVGTSGAVQNTIDRRFGGYRPTEEILYFQDGRILRLALLGFRDLAADLYWLRAVQYYGGKRVFEPDKRFDLLEPLLQVTTDLDPRLTIAYRYGAIFLSEPFPGGPGLPLRAIALIDKGIENNPSYWRFYQDKGFVYYWYMEDYQKAAETFVEGSKVQGAPYWMVATAGRILSEGGHRETARQLWRIMYDGAEHEAVRSNAIVHLQQLDALDQLDLLNRVLFQFKEHAGRFPASWEEVIREGFLLGAPADPSGTPYSLDPVNERATISQSSPLIGAPKLRGRTSLPRPGGPVIRR